MANREIKFYKHYFNEFYVAQTDKVRKKKTQKTPSGEIEKAERLMKEYFETKEAKE